MILWLKVNGFLKIKNNGLKKDGIMTKSVCLANKAWVGFHHRAALFACSEVFRGVKDLEMFKKICLNIF